MANMDNVNRGLARIAMLRTAYGIASAAMPLIYQAGVIGWGVPLNKADADRSFLIAEQIGEKIAFDGAKSRCSTWSADDA